MDRVDERLTPFLSATDAAEAQEALGALISELQPVVRGVIHRKLGLRSPASEIDDVSSDVMVSVLERLEHLRANASAEPIVDLRAYAAVVAYNACHGLIRRKHPRRWRFKNRIRYVVTRSPGFALWEGESGEMLCGLERWRGRNVAEPGHLHAILTNRALASSGGLDEAEISNLRGTLQTLLEQANGPVELEALVNGLAEVSGIDDRPESNRSEPADGVADARGDFATKLERRSYLEQLWSEIRELPVRQRTALLLNLRDLHEGVIALLPLTGIASIRQIAEVLEISANEFANLWNQLPIDDATIARRLGITGQQVINLRKSARERLARRMRGR